MIRFVDIRGQGTGYRFMFWNTSADQPCLVGGCFAWNSFAEFLEDAPHSDIDAERFRRLCPAWVDDGQEDDIAAFYAGGNRAKPGQEKGAGGHEPPTP